MAIKWGSPTSQTRTGNQARLGYEFIQSPSRITSSTTSVSVTLRLYVSTRLRIWDQYNTFGVSGDFNGGKRGTLLNHPSGTAWSGSNQTLLGTWTKTVSTSTSSTSRLDFNAFINTIEYAPGTARLSASHTVGIRPIGVVAPNQVSNISVTRSSDNRHTVKWTNNATTKGPYERIEVQRWDSLTGEYRSLSSRLSGGTTSYVDAKTDGGKRYRYRVAAYNTAGGSGWAYGNYLHTTPSTPVEVSASKSGRSLVVRWAQPNNNVINSYIIRAHNLTSGGYQDFTLQGGALFYTHSNPAPEDYFEYQIRGEAEGLYSAWSKRSNRVVLITQPNKPTDLTPDDVGFDTSSTDSTLSWAHTSDDGSNQSAYQLRVKVTLEDATEPTTAWTELSKVSTGSTSNTFPDDLEPLTVRDQMEWQVRTWGDHSEPSPWSDTARTFGSIKPNLEVLSPVDTFYGSRLSIDYRFEDPTIYPDMGEPETPVVMRAMAITANEDAPLAAVDDEFELVDGIGTFFPLHNDLPSSTTDGGQADFFALWLYPEDYSYEKYYEDEFATYVVNDDDFSITVTAKDLSTNGVRRIEYNVDDTGGYTANAVMSITFGVGGGLLEPSPETGANDDEFWAEYMTPTILNPLENDVLPEGYTDLRIPGPLDEDGNTIWGDITETEWGTFVVNEDNTVTYDPGSHIGSVWINYRVYNDAEDYFQAQLSVMISAPSGSEPISAIDDEFAVFDGTGTFFPLENDTPSYVTPEDETTFEELLLFDEINWEYVKVFENDIAVFEVNEDFSVTVTLTDPDFTGPSTIDYEVRDSLENFAYASMTFTFMKPVEPLVKPARQAKFVLRDASGNEVHTSTATGDLLPYTDLTHTFIRDIILENEGYYSVDAQVQNMDGLWSDVDTVNFQALYKAPMPAIIEREWDEFTGSMVINYINQDPIDDTYAKTSYVSVVKVIDGVWETLGERLSPNSQIVDPMPRTDYPVEYHVRSFSSQDIMTASSTGAFEIDSKGWIYVNGGPNHQDVVRVRDNANVSVSGARARNLYHFAGRDFPVEITGQSRTKSISVSARLGGDSSTVGEWASMMDLPAPLFYRDRTHAEFVSPSGFSHTHQRATREMSLSFEVIDR